MRSAVGRLPLDHDVRAGARRRAAHDGTAPLRTVDEAMRSGDPLLRLKALAVRAVVGLVPASAALFIALSRRRAIEDAVATMDPDLQLDMDALWARYDAAAFRTDPFARALLDPPGATVLTLAQVKRRNPSYVDTLHRLGLADRTVMYLRGSGMVLAMVSLVRTDEHPRFTWGDVAALRQIQSLIEHVYAGAVEPARARGSSFDVLRHSELTAREAEVADLVGRGASNADIACALRVSEPTVKSHLSHIYAKVGVQTRTQLAILVGASAPRP
jgi:DNA-binding CsgD family transcriptional regulator